MAEGKNSAYFKLYERGRRVQTIEETMSEGQVFTRAPLDNDRVRVLTNYDLINDGEAITNRKGIRTTKLALPIYPGLLPRLGSLAQVTLGVDTVREDNKHHRLCVAHQLSNTQSGDHKRMLSDMEFWVMDVTNGAWSSDCLSRYDIDVSGFYAINLGYEAPLEYDSSHEYIKNDLCLHNDQLYCCLEKCTGAWDATKWESTTYPKNYCIIPEDTDVHGFKLESNEAKALLSRPIGAFAWQGTDYYTFNTAHSLIRARYQRAEGSLSASYYAERVKPKVITVAEASKYGFNMLLDEPYEFSDAYNQEAMNVLGIACIQDGKMFLEPLINLPYKYRCYYTVKKGDKYKIIWDYKSSTSSEDSDYIGIKTEEKTFSEDSPAELYIPDFSSPYESIVMRVRVFKYNGSSYPDDPTSSIRVGFFYAQSASQNIANRTLINYDLTTATGMAYWKGRLWLYGIEEDPTILFYSDVNEPSYFPYPSNINAFDEPVLHVLPFNDTLLIFTKSQMWQATFNESGSGVTYKILQGNLNFTDFDVRFIQIVKNMVFFKSGDYYYMIVPKTLSLKNEYALAPVSKNIDYFLDEFYDNATELFKVLYDYTGSLELVNHYNYLSYEDVHNIYTFKTETNLYLNLDLLYNTVDRTWRMYTYESQTPYYPLRQDATKSGELMTAKPIVMQPGATDMVALEFLENHRTEIKDFYIPNNTTFTVGTGSVIEPDQGEIESAFEAMHTYKNYQLLDTGYRNQLIDYNKRYRELQIKFNNVSTARIQFFTEFILDGDTRVSRFKYETEHIVDPTQPNYGLIHIVRTPVENLELPGTTILAEGQGDINAWTLDSSRFPEVAYWKARLKVSGKGYTPRFRLLCRMEERYELLGYTWVYRQLYSR